MNYILSDFDGNFYNKIKSYNIFDAIQNISLAWKNVSTLTIQNCFKCLFETKIDEKLQISLFGKKDEIEQLINYLKELSIIDVKMDDLEYLSMESKENITKKDIPDELIPSIMKDFCKSTNKGPPQTKIEDVKRLKGLLSEIKKTK